MKLSDVRRVQHLSRERDDISRIIGALNKINGGEELISFPVDTLFYVDRQLAAKGLLSLILERAAEVDNKLKELGVEV